VFLNKLVSALNLEVELDNIFLHDHISSLFEKLPLKYREVMVLKYFEEKSYEEISDILENPIGTVGTLVNRAKKQFRELYEKEQAYVR
jgi:RNA polymerase sigma-70 factor, ECF subfamily